MKNNFTRYFYIHIAVLLFTQALFAQSPPDSANVRRTLYTVGYSHLDTEWRWDYRTTISEYLKNTMLDNFRLFEKYPNYVFNFSGANRYMMMEEYYPDEYGKVRILARAGRWFACGSSVEENDVLIPSAESIIRQVLLGNGYFRKEFGTASSEYMLPDCFGFPHSLPSILAHCGIKGFSTQKLTWGSASGIPFKIGQWVGPDGNRVIAVFNPGDYVGQVSEDLSRSEKWLKRINDLGLQTGIYSEYAYYGTGDIGGAPAEESVSWVEKSINGTGPIRVISAAADRFFNDLTDDQKSKLPEYRGELLLTNHSAGSLTSQSYMKRWNRKNEILAFSAEAASVLASHIGSLSYPREKINEAWRLVLGAQFHDIMAGTCTPKSYEFSWNDEILAANQFSEILTDAAGVIARSFDTSVEGIPVLTFNPVSYQREDAVEATVSFEGVPPDFVRVFDRSGNERASQILKRDGNEITVLFLADLPPLGFAVYDVRPSESPSEGEEEVKIYGNILENSKYKIEIDPNGDVSSIIDKTDKRELLSSPARLAFLYEKPMEYPAWNMDWNDRKNPPSGFVGGKAVIRTVEKGPVRAAFEIEREFRGSKFVQHVSLTSGGERVEFRTKIEWYTPESSLKALFPLTVSNPEALYSAQVGTVTRAGNDEKKFEVPSQGWFDITDTGGAYGVSVLDDSKYGSDKPDDSTLRLTLLYTPGVRSGYKDQASQDFGRHYMMYALCGHSGDPRLGGSQKQSDRLNKPIMAFRTSPHAGTFKSPVSLISVEGGEIVVTAVKKSENNERIVVRLMETGGTGAKRVVLSAVSPISEAIEIDGQESMKGNASVENGKLIFEIGPYSLLSFALELEEFKDRSAPPVCEPVALTYDADIYSFDSEKSDGRFDSTGASFPAELVPDTVSSGGIIFKLGPKMNGEKNALICAGQTVSLPGNGYSSLYILAASSGKRAEAAFEAGGISVPLGIESWSGFIGQWDNRIWDGDDEKKQDYAWDDITYAGLTPAYIKKDPVALFTTHRHLPGGNNDPYAYAYLFKYRIPVPTSASEIRLPDDDRIKIAAITAVRGGGDITLPASALFDTASGDGSGYERFQVSLKPVITPEAGIIEKGSSLTVTILSREPDADIRYTTDGSQPDEESEKYVSPLTIEGTALLQASAFKTGKQPSAPASAKYQSGYAVSEIKYMSGFSAKYTGRGEKGLIDGKRGTESFTNKSWQGFEQNDLEAVLDLGRVRSVRKVTLGCLSDNTSWIFLPASVEIYLSADGVEFGLVNKTDYPIPSSNAGNFTADLESGFKEREARWIRIKAENVGECPKWHPGSGGKAWIFADEIIVE